MKKLLTKLGTYYYYGNDGKRIAKKEYDRRVKISKARKAQVKASKKISKKTSKKISKKTSKKALKFSTHTEIKSSKNKVIGNRWQEPLSNGWIKNVYKGKPENLVIHSYQKNFDVNTDWVDSIDELLDIMMEKSMEIIDSVKSSDNLTKYISLGYNFSIQYTKSDGSTHEFTSTGFSPRISINRSIKDFRDKIDISFDDIASRFEGYLNREATSALRLNFIILEKLLSQKHEKTKKKK